MDEDLEIFLEDFCDFLNALETSIAKMKQQIAKLVGISELSIPEETFKILKWVPEVGARLGDYETAYKDQNVREYWQRAYNILKKNNAVIGNQFHLEGYEHRYWLFPEKYDDRIFRKKLNGKR